MLYAGVRFLLEHTVIPLLDDVRLTLKVKADVKELEKELKRMKAYLEDESKRQNMEEHFKVTMRQMREVVHKVEDIMETYILQSQSVMHIITHPENIDFGKKVIELRKKVKDVLDLAEREFSGHGNTSRSFDTAQETKSIRKKVPREDHVVGLEEQTNTLIIDILANKEGLDVFSIVGMPGLGKTTLAWKIYRDPRIQYEFPTLIWIYFSQDFNMRNVLVTILQKFTKTNMSRKTITDLVEMVRDHLKKGKFVIFIDDVWDVEAWLEIDRLLPKSNEMVGRVVMTTRHTDVARRASFPRDPHELQFLPIDQSLELLRLEVYGKSAKEFDFQTSARNIAEKCGGLPLAIIVIGGILVDKYSKSEWTRISDDVAHHLIEKDRGENLKKILSWSYKNLPYDLRNCFLYLGMFPEYTKIPALKLTQLWIAEGFIKKNSRESLEETAQDNLKELINRNLVMVERTKLNGDVKTCRVHDTIREFCQNEAKPNGQDLFQEISKSNTTGFEPSDEDIVKCRRLSIHSHVKAFFLKKLKLPNTRSFVCTLKEDINLENKDISSIMEGFKLIRVLDVSPIIFPIFSTKAPDLMNLRYLTLSFTELKFLPGQMSKLCNMQTLTVNTMTQRTLKVNFNIWEMQQLRHLKTNASIILMSGGKGDGGQNLQTLSRLSTSSCTYDVFNKAKNLKTLGIHGDLNKILDSNFLHILECLEKLKLHHDVESKISLHSFPDRLPLNIKFLTLSATYLDWHHMSAVGKLRTLEVLKLKENAFDGDDWKAVTGGFCQLEFLYILRTNLVVWTASDDSFPKLRSLVLKNCEKLQGVPNNLVENLAMLSMERVTEDAVISAWHIEKKRKEAEGNQMAKKEKFKLIVSPADERKARVRQNLQSSST